MKDFRDIPIELELQVKEYEQVLLSLNKTLNNQCSDIRKEDVMGLEESINQIKKGIDRLKNLQISIAAFGETNAGKSALLNSLIGHSNEDPHAPFKVHERINIWSKEIECKNGVKWHDFNNLELILYDTPGIGGDILEHLDIAKKIASESDIILYVVWLTVRGDLQKAVMKELLETEKPLIVVINKVDTQREIEIKATKDDIQEKMGIKESCFVLAAGHPKQGEPIIEDLTENIFSIIKKQNFDLINKTIQSWVNKGVIINNIIADEVEIAREARKQKAAIIIHSAASAASLLAGLLAQGATFGADTPFLTVITIGMIVALGTLFDKKITKTAATAVISQNFGAFAGVALAKAILGWIPILGNFANASITFGLHEATGWACYLIFEDNRDISKLSEDEFKRYKIRAENMEKPNTSWIKTLPSHIKIQYDSLVRKLADKNVSDDERQGILKEIEKLTEPYRKDKSDVRNGLS